MTKAELRKIRLTAQKNLSAADRKQKSAQIAKLFFDEFDLRRINFLHCFLPIEKFKEIDTRLILQKIWRDFPHIETLVPRINFQTNELESLRFSAAHEVRQNLWQIDEPTHDETVAAEKIDAVLVPLLGFDRNGFRAGYGKGFYDKFLSNCRAGCLKIGLNYFAPIDEITDAEAHDVRLDYCIAPEKLWKFAA